MSSFITKAETKEYLKQVGYQLHEISGIGGSSRTGLHITSRYEIICTRMTPKGEKFEAFIGRITKATWDALIPICDKHRLDINPASGTGNGVYYWVSVEKRLQIK